MQAEDLVEEQQATELGELGIDRTAQTGLECCLDAAGEACSAENLRQILFGVPDLCNCGRLSGVGRGLTAGGGERDAEEREAHRNSSMG